MEETTQLLHLLNTDCSLGIVHICKLCVYECISSACAASDLCTVFPSVSGIRPLNLFFVYAINFVYISVTQWLYECGRNQPTAFLLFSVYAINFVYINFCNSSCMSVAGIRPLLFGCFLCMQLILCNTMVVRVW